MLQKSFYWLIVCLCVCTLFCGCTPTANVYTVMEVNDNGYIVLDKSGNLFSIGKDFSTMNALGKNYEELKPVAPLQSYGTVYKLSNKELSFYDGTLADAIAYCNFLQEQGYTLSSIQYNSRLFDTKLNTVDDEVRVLYLGGDTVRIFYKNFSENALFPPYINE